MEDLIRAVNRAGHELGGFKEGDELSFIFLSEPGRGPA
jgi:hypothetical protein